MGAPDSAEQTFHPAESRMRGIRRVWKWGIGFWLLAWIYSALVVKLGISFYLGGYEVILGVSSGSFYADFVRSPPFGGIQWIRPVFVFTEHRLEQLLDYPEDIFAQLGRTGSPQFGIPGSLAFPMAGVLWLWLLLGWTDGFKKFQWLKSVKSPRMLARILILVGLPLLISFSEYSGRKLEDTFSCMMTSRNIQQAVRGHQGMNNLPNGPLNWNDIFGPKGYLEPKYFNCPSGLPYRLSKNLPDMGELAAECQNLDHLKRIKSKARTEKWW